MTTWRIVEGSNDEGHPAGCTWTLLYVSQYDVIINPVFFEENPFKRVIFRISEKKPNKTPYFNKENVK